MSPLRVEALNANCDGWLCLAEFDPSPTPYSFTQYKPEEDSNPEVIQFWCVESNSHSLIGLNGENHQILEHPYMIAIKPNPTSDRRLYRFTHLPETQLLKNSSLRFKPLDKLRSIAFRALQYSQNFSIL